MKEDGFESTETEIKDKCGVIKSTDTLSKFLSSIHSSHMMTHNYL